ncbi:MAG: hypothetical protein VYB59_09785, partial [Pseudomonadota bacterium]|nr:hypothetical protein [Pseudomonadota bacterium]
TKVAARLQTPRQVAGPATAPPVQEKPALPSGIAPKHSECRSEVATVKTQSFHCSDIGRKTPFDPAKSGRLREYDEVTTPHP